MAMIEIDSRPRRPDLGERVLACLRQACSEGRIDVAEQLLAAIEQLAVDDHGAADPERHRQLSKAYGAILELAGKTVARH